MMFVTIILIDNYATRGAIYVGMQNSVIRIMGINIYNSLSLIGKKKIINLKLF